MINKKSFNQIQQEAVNYLLENTGITQLETGGAARSLVDVFSKHLADFYSRLDIDLSMAYLSTANGFYLDLLGNLFGVNRTSQNSVNVLAEDKILKFYVAEGAVLSDSIPTLTIPSGTNISTPDSSVVYTTTEDASFLQMDSHVFVSASAQASSTQEAAGVGQMNTHSLGLPGVLVTNMASLSVGNFVENDDDYRARIAASNTARQGANETAVRIAAIGVENVADVSVTPYSRGSGSFEVMVIPTGNRVPQASMDRIRAGIETVSAYGVTFDVREPDYVQLKLEMRVNFRQTTSDEQKAVLLRSIEASVLSYIGDIRPGEEMSISRVQSLALSESSEVQDAVVTYLCVDKKAQIVRNVRLEDDELFVPDEDTANPIVIRT